MKIPRSLIAGAAVLILLGASSAFAQGGRPGGGRGGGQGGPPPLPDAEQIEAMVDELDETLDLSDEQEVQITDLYVAHFEAVEEAMSGGRPDRSAMEAMRKEFQEAVKAVLDDDQKEAFDEYLESKEKSRGGRRQRR